MGELHEVVTIAVAHLEKLVAFDTVSRNSNLDLIRWSMTLLEAAGAKTRLTYDRTGTKANLLAVLGPDVPGAVVLSAHTDTVPVDGQIWSSDPFSLTERNGRFHGRGAVDMKGFIACCLAAVPAFAEAPLKRPICLAFSYDEEIGCFGVPSLIDDLLLHVPRPAFAVVGEPTSMRIGVQHRGYLGFRTVFRGQAAHSGDPSGGVNAIAAAARFVGLVEEKEKRRTEALHGTTWNAGTIWGGTNVNVVPSQCEVRWEIRPGEEADPAQLRWEADEMLARAAPAGFAPETEEIIKIPPLRPETHNQAITVANRAGALRPFAEMPFGTEGGFFQAAGIPTVVCGPGSISEAHQADEWIAAGQLAEAMLFLEGIRRWAEA